MKSSDFVFIENVTELSCEFIHNASNLSAAFSIELLGISFVEWVASLQLKKIVHKDTNMQRVIHFMRQILFVITYIFKIKKVYL